MNIEIRRNLNLSAKITLSNEQAKSLKDMCEINIPPNIESFLKENDKKLRELEEKIWIWFNKNPTKDQLGNLITPKTHKIGFDYNDKLEDGLNICIWVMPIKSEYDSLIFRRQGTTSTSGCNPLRKRSF